jgi:Lysylphosphatidylglycerol synthase TM region
MKKLGQIAISLGLTLLIGFILYRGVPDWGQAWRVMIQGRPLLLLAGFAFVMLHMLLRAVRWGVLLSPVKAAICLRNLFSLTLVKYVVNVIPPRAGEVAASVVLAKKERISIASGFAAREDPRHDDCRRHLWNLPCLFRTFVPAQLSTRPRDYVDYSELLDGGILGIVCGIDSPGCSGSQSKVDEQNASQGPTRPAALSGRIQGLAPWRGFVPGWASFGRDLVNNYLAAVVSGAGLPRRVSISGSGVSNGHHGRGGSHSHSRGSWRLSVLHESGSGQLLLSIPLH